MRKASKRADRTPDSPRTRAIKLLSRREHGAEELIRKLSARGIDHDEARAAVAALRDEGWQSDLRYAAAVIRTRAAQGYGPRRVRHELEGAGIGEAEIAAALHEEGVDWLGVARDWAERRVGDAFFSPVERARQWRKLAARGFDADVVRQVLGELDDSL